MEIPNELLLPGLIPNLVIIDLKTREKVVLYAVDYDDDVVLIGPLEGRRKKDWVEKCWIISKSELIQNYEIYEF